MKVGVLGLIASDLTDVDERLTGFAGELGFAGVCAHVTREADSIDRTVAERAAETVRAGGLEFLQLWGPYPSIVSPDEDVRRRGVAAARGIVRLAAAMGIPAAGIRPTGHNPRGDWWPHPDNHTSATEETFVRSLSEIVETAVEVGIGIVLEKHQTSVLDSAARVRRIIERTAPEVIRVNIDTANFVNDLTTAFDPAPMIEEFFEVLGPYCATVHVKDIYLEERFVVHISETIIGTGIMDIDTMLLCADRLGPETYVMVEHLPVSQIPLAKRNLDAKIRALGINVT